MKSKSDTKNFPVVCVGGSAGGLDAYTRLLRNLPGDMGVAIVIVNHLRTVATMLHKILPGYTKMLADGLGLKAEVKRIYVMFKIDKEGNISDVQARAAHIKLQEEAIRVISSLPKMIPGKHKGKTVNVKYSLPIAFKVGANKVDSEIVKRYAVETGDNKVEWEYVKGEDVPFAMIENVPVFPGCEGTEAELKTCLQEKITNFVSANFNAKLTEGLGLLPGLKKVFVMFKIDKEGNITNVQARGPHQSIADEATRVINLLPKMKPGKHKGDAVGVKYALPIAFKVE
ncbi:MAG: energy transducer TonB [Lutibacter sp.]